MADAFVIGGDGVSLFASVGIMMPLASRQEDVSDPLKESDLRDRLMQDLGLSDTADSDEEEWAPDPTIALKLDGFREPLKDSELQDRLMKDLGLSDSDEEEWVPKTKLATLESEEEERHFKSQFDSKDSDEEEWIPSSEGEEEEEWRPKSRVDYKESDEEEWVSGASSDTSESDEEEWAPESQTDPVVRVSLRRRRHTDDRRHTRRSTKEWQSHPVVNSANSHEPLPVKCIEDHGDDKGCLHQGCGSQPKLNGRCPAHSVKCSKLGCRKVVLRGGKCFSHCRLAVCSYPECMNFVRDATMCFKHRDKEDKEARDIPGSKKSCVSNVSPVKSLGLLNTASLMSTGTQRDITVTGTGRAIA
ncbi:hypothetical protein PF010_g25186 [Phytophthora fragariae]|uniref:Uncharacterized protein n=1 Tax=Phytophthora fragariae TaxID=53985 RepID=A0A6G0K1B4_9STRA|nr:hypothetical protein PF010_g25186 [Phytophthora fragariae]